MGRAVGWRLRHQPVPASWWQRKPGHELADVLAATSRASQGGGRAHGTVGKNPVDQDHGDVQLETLQVVNGMRVTI
jgi:hypothetical protein